MSSTYVSAEMRRAVVERAGGICEYCLIHEDDTFFGCEVDHIISEKHGGPTDPSNLAFACFVCNRRKGSDIGSILPSTSVFVRFFNPRTDLWAEHFTLADDALLIEPRTDIGAATARILAFNDPERQMEREALHAVGRYPPAAALPRISGDS